MAIVHGSVMQDELDRIREAGYVVVILDPVDKSEETREPGDPQFFSIDVFVNCNVEDLLLIQQQKIKPWTVMSERWQVSANEDDENRLHVHVRAADCAPVFDLLTDMQLTAPREKELALTFTTDQIEEDNRDLDNE